VNRLTDENYLSSNQHTREASFENVKKWIEENGGVNEDLGDGHTQLFYSARDNNILEVEYLCRRGATVNLENDDFKNTPLDFAVSEYDNFEAVKILLMFGSNINHQNSMKQTALHRAASEGFYESTKTLILAGADLTLLDSNGDIAKSVAKDKALDAFIEIETNGLTKVTPKNLPKLERPKPL